VIRRQQLREAVLAENLVRGRSSGVFVFVEDAAKSVASSDAEPGDLVWISDRCG
jgi:hypothetical protein